MNKGFGTSAIYIDNKNVLDGSTQEVTIDGAAQVLAEKVRKRARLYTLGGIARKQTTHHLPN